MVKARGQERPGGPAWLPEPEREPPPHCPPRPLPPGGRGFPGTSLPGAGATDPMAWRFSVLLGTGQARVRGPAQTSVQPLNCQLLVTFGAKQPMAVAAAGNKGGGGRGGRLGFQTISFSRLISRLQRPFPWNDPPFTDEERGLGRETELAETHTQETSHFLPIMAGAPRCWLKGDRPKGGGGVGWVGGVPPMRLSRLAAVGRWLGK